MDIRERILKYIDYKGITKYKFYQEIGVANGFLDKNGSIGSDKCEKICYQYPDLSLKWLITGKGKMLLTEVLTTEGVQQQVEATKYNNNVSGNPIPLVNEGAVAGFGNSHFSIAEQDVKDYYIVPKFKESRVDFMIEVLGDSMYPKYSNGDIIACRIIKDSQFIQYNKTHVIATREQGILVKRLKKSEDTNFILAVSDNKEYDPFMIPVDEITGMALVVGVIRLV